MKICFILNPRSGRNRRHPRRIEEIRALIDQRRLDAQLLLTEGPGHATILAKGAREQGCDRVVAIGGDGTLNEIAKSLVGTGVTVGLIPGGSGDGLGRHLGLPRSFREAWALVTQLHPPIAALDTGTVNGRPFCNVMGFGFDADVGQRFNRLHRRSAAHYAGVTIAALRNLRPVSCTIMGGETSRSMDVLLLAVANSSQYGNHALIAPAAEVDDGLLDLVAIQPGSFIGTTSLLPSLFLGTLHQRRRVIHQRATRFLIERRQSGLVHTDGETLEMDARLEVEIRRSSLQMIVPAVRREPPIEEPQPALTPPYAR